MHVLSRTYLPMLVQRIVRATHQKRQGPHRSIGALSEIGSGLFSSPIGKGSHLPQIYYQPSALELKPLGDRGFFYKYHRFDNMPASKILSMYQHINGILDSAILFDAITTHLNFSMP
jgi:hypothetical protein